MYIIVIIYKMNVMNITDIMSIISITTVSILVFGFLTNSMILLVYPLTKEKLAAHTIRICIGIVRNILTA